MIPTKQRIARAIQFYKKSHLFQVIDYTISKYYRKKLKNDQFTILCSNCVGGTLYHRYGKRFLSPTINMWMPNTDFVEFVIHLDYYLEQELLFIESDEETPVAQLVGNSRTIPTITLHFNHDKDSKTAEAKWNERKTRIVKDNMFIMLYNLDGITLEQIKRLEAIPCKNKVIFTAMPLPEVSWSWYIKPVSTHRYPYAYLDKDVFGVRYLEKHFNCSAFLNGEIIR